MKRLWLDPGFGASGDMLLGVLVALGAPIDDVRADLAGLGVSGWSIDEQPTDRAGIGATRVTVDVDHTHDDDHTHDHDHDHTHDEDRRWSAIDELLASARLPIRVATGARATFRLLGEVEAAIHGVGIDDVHFHEVGAVDAIVDIVGAWAALDRLGVDEVHAGPVGLGAGGTVVAAHGTLPVPAPATLDLLTGLPVKGLDSPQETVTPTGAALLATMVDTWGPIPAGRLQASARGAGGRNPDTHPNVVSGVLIEAGPAPQGDPAAVPSFVLSTNLDDTTPEILGHTIDRLLAAGVDDAWLVPIGMKKNRPGQELRVLCRPGLVDDVAGIVFAETGTLGLRIAPVEKRVLARRFETVTIRGRSIRIKIGPHGAKPEHDDVVAAANQLDVPVRQLALEAVRVHEAAREVDGI